MTIRMARRRHARGASGMSAIVLLSLGIVLSAGDTAAQPAGAEKIQHLIVIYQENWSFDGLYGKFPGAEGIANAGDRIALQHPLGSCALPFGRHAQLARHQKTALSSRPRAQAVGGNP